MFSAGEFTEVLPANKSLELAIEDILFRPRAAVARAISGGERIGKTCRH